MTTPNREFESLTQVQWREWTVRVWRTEASLADACAAFNLDVNHVCQKTVGTVAELAEALEKLPRVSAIQIADVDGNGIALYPDWK